MFVGHLTKMPYSNMKVDQAQQKNLDAPSNSGLHKQTTRVSQKHKFSGAVIFDEDRDGSQGFHGEELVSDDDHGLNSNRGLILKNNNKKRHL